MPELEQKSLKRQVAYKERISDILNSTFVKDGTSAGCIRLNGIDVSRVNIIATVVYKADDINYASAVIDDGTARISLRSFEKSSIFSKIDIGDAVLVIGRIREFNNERYVAPEILKKIDNAGWLNARKLELKGNPISRIDEKIEGKEAEEETSDIKERAYSLIKKLDDGNGAPAEDVVNALHHTEAENVLNKMLENGDVFEVKPGRLKVLE